MASCGTGCRGSFDVTLAVHGQQGPVGLLRVYDLSAKDGTPETIRDYPVWLTLKSATGLERIFDAPAVAGASARLSAQRAGGVEHQFRSRPRRFLPTP